MNGQRHLVTGGTGFIGRSLVRKLVELDFEVTVLDDNSRGSIKFLSDIEGKFEFISGDIRNAETVTKACEAIDCVWHLAYINGTEFFYTKPDLVLDVGIKGITNVIDACIKQNVKELFVASSSEVYQTPDKIPTDEKVALSIPNPFNPRYSYGCGKIVSEIMAINYGRKYFDRVVIFRPHNVYGAAMGWEHVIPQFCVRIKKLCKELDDSIIRFPIYGTGEETRAFCYIDDFIDGLILLHKHANNLEIYNIGTQEEIMIKHVAKEIGRYFGREIEIISGELITGSTTRRCPDINKIKKLGFSPKYSLSEGLNITASWYEKNFKFAPPEKDEMVWVQEGEA